MPRGLRDELLCARGNSTSVVPLPMRQPGCHDDLDARTHRRTQMQQLWPVLEPGIWHRDGTNRSELGTPTRRRCCPVSSGTCRAKRSELRVYNVCSGRILAHLTKSLRCLKKALSGLRSLQSSHRRHFAVTLGEPRRSVRTRHSCVLQRSVQAH